MDQQIAFVTGASRGIGKACAVWLARAGYDVAITARSVQEGEAREHSSTVASSNTKPLPGSLSTTADLIRAEGRQAITVPADLLDRASLGAAVATVIERWGGIDVLVNNAATALHGDATTTPWSDIEHLVRLDYLSPVRLTLAALPAMRTRGAGHVLTLSSMAARMSSPGEAAYAAAKAALSAFFEALAGELWDSGIRFHLVYPALITHTARTCSSSMPLRAGCRVARRGSTRPRPPRRSFSHAHRMNPRTSAQYTSADACVPNRGTCPAASSSTKAAPSGP